MFPVRYELNLYILFRTNSIRIEGQESRREWLESASERGRSEESRTGGYGRRVNL
jgi:hypothetical protein